MFVKIVAIIKSDEEHVHIEVKVWDQEKDQRDDVSFQDKSSHLFAKPRSIELLAGVDDWDYECRNKDQSIS